MMTKRRIALAGAAAMAGLMLTACGSGGDATKVSANSEAQVPVAAEGAPSAAPATPSAAPSEAPAAAAPNPAPNAPVPGRTNWKGGLSLSAVQNPTVGLTVVDNKGFTLYRFDKDTAKPSVSNCSGACAKAWPPVKFTDKLKLKGVNRALIGNIMRKDGICQATLGGWPLYRFAKDTAPGDAKGQGIGGTWFAVAPNGKKATGGSEGGGAPAAPNSGNAPGSTGSGYGS